MPNRSNLWNLARVPPADKRTTKHVIFFSLFFGTKGVLYHMIYVIGISCSQPVSVQHVAGTRRNGRLELTSDWVRGVRSCPLADSFVNLVARYSSRVVSSCRVACMIRNTEKRTKYDRRDMSFFIISTCITSRNSSKKTTCFVTAYKRKP